MSRLMSLGACLGVLLGSVMLVCAQPTRLKLEITAPLLNEDGSPLTDLGGYVVCQSDASIPDDRGTADCSITVSAPRPDPQPGLICPHGSRRAAAKDGASP